MRRALAVAFLGVLALALPRPASAQFGPQPSFAAPTAIPLNTNPHFIGVGDLNKDGNPDLVICIEATVPSSLYVLLVNGTGGFTFHSQVNVDTFPVSVAIADFNGDTSPDVVVANSASTSSNLSVLQGDGTGALLGRVLPRDHGFCPHVVARRKALVLEDVSDYPRFAGNPVVDEFGIRSYMGAPLIDSTGMVLGTVSVTDVQPRAWGQPGLAAIKAQAADLVVRLERREDDGLPP